MAISKRTLEDIGRDWQQEHQANLREDGLPWGHHWGGDTHMEWLSALLTTHIAGKKVFEIGCGGGRMTKMLLDLGATEVLACDVHMTAIDDAYKYEPRARYIKSDGETIPAQISDQFDLVFTYDVLLHLPPSLVLQYMGEARRVAKEMIFQLPSLNLPGGRKWFGQYVAHKAWRKPYSLGYFNFYADEQVYYYATMAGWRHMEELGNNERDKVWKLAK